MSSPEAELVADLDAHDALVAEYARGDLSWADFEKAYDWLYVRYPLDGHESDAEELRLFEKHASRITLHRAIWNEVLTKVTGDEQGTNEATTAEPQGQGGQLARAGRQDRAEPHAGDPEAAKLKISLLDGAMLPPATDLAQVRAVRRVG